MEAELTFPAAAGNLGKTFSASLVGKVGELWSKSELPSYPNKQN
jgi:hypothetical protein